MQVTYLKEEKHEIGVDEIQDAVELLSEHFKIPVPHVKVTWNQGSKCSYRRSYWGFWSEMSISRDDWHGITDCVLHEFTHALRGFRSGKHYHDVRFFLALKEVCEVWLGDAEWFRWDRDYNPIWKQAVRHRLTRRTWFRHTHKFGPFLSAEKIAAYGTVK